MPQIKPPYPIPTAGIQDKAITKPKLLETALSPFYIVGQYYGSPLTSLLPVADIYSHYVVATLFPITRDIKIDRMGFYLYTQEPSKYIRVGIYDSDPVTYYPKNLVVDAGAVLMAPEEFKSVTVDVTLTKGLYYVAWLTDSTLGRLLASAHPCIGIYGFREQGGAIGSYEKSQIYGPLPDPYPSGGFPNSTVWGIYLRVAQLL